MQIKEKKEQPALLYANLIKKTWFIDDSPLQVSSVRKRTRI